MQVLAKLLNFFSSFVAISSWTSKTWDLVITTFSIFSNMKDLTLSLIKIYLISGKQQQKYYHRKAHSAGASGSASAGAASAGASPSAASFFWNEINNFLSDEDLKSPPQSLPPPPSSPQLLLQVSSETLKMKLILFRFEKSSPRLSYLLSLSFFLLLRLRLPLHSLKSN